MSSAEELAESILGSCCCHKDYKCRGRKDPHCAWCEYGEELVSGLTQARAEAYEEMTINLENRLPKPFTTDAIIERTKCVTAIRNAKESK